MDNSSSNSATSQQRSLILLTQEMSSLEPERLRKKQTQIEQMELGGWNSDLDSSLLNCWNDNAETSSDPKDKKKYDNKSTSSAGSSPLRSDRSSWDGNLNQWSRFPSFNVDYEATPSEKSKSSEVDNKASQDNQSQMPRGSVTLQNGAPTTNTAVSTAQRGPPAVSETTSVTSATKDASSVTGLSDASTRVQQPPSRAPPANPTNGGSRSQNVPHLHPLAIQSSATCPPHSSNNSHNKTAPPEFGQIPLPPSSIIPPEQQQPHHPPQNINGLNFAHALDTSVASLAASLQRTDNHATSSTASAVASTNHHLNSLAANFMLAQSGPDSAAASTAGQAHAHAAAHQAAALPSANNSHHHSAPTIHQLSSSNSMTATSISAESGNSSSSSSARPSHHQPHPSHQGTGTLPPFYLFDAPIELRANFEQNQRKLGIPVQHDCNSYHYGEVVKGFHPQQLLNQQPYQATGNPPRGAVQLIDARHGNNRQQGSGRVKNEREQKRAQKITELIDQLRVNMENGGWKVEMRSKFHTLSSCAEYVKHMIKTMKEKEETVNKLKSDLEVKQQKFEEDKALQESRSDPESVTSSLTSSTTGSSQACHQKVLDGDKKRKAGSKDSSGNKKQRKCSRHMSSVSTNEDSSGEDRGSRGPSAQSFSIDKTVSSVSDITDSNRGSSSNNSGSGSAGSEVPTEQVSHVSTDEGDEEQPSSSSISSDAAVASEKSSRGRHSGGHHHKHKDVVFNHEKRPDRKRPPEEVTSLERSFELDYEEVFDKSNIPQLIASTSGKIVTWNECFIKATGLRKSEVERMTIFSLVKPEKLVNFFEIVAAALRPDNEDEEDSSKNDEPLVTTDEDTDTKSGGESGDSEGKGAEGDGKLSERQWNYAAMTLPCIDFPAIKNRLKAGEQSHHNDPLHVTVTLMTDKDPRKRCFHCVFTNCPGTEGALGSITPELLGSLFSQAETSSKGGKTHHHSKSKRARLQNDPPPRVEKKIQQQEPQVQEEENKEVEQDKRNVQGA